MPDDRTNLWPLLSVSECLRWRELFSEWPPADRETLAEARRVARETVERERVTETGPAVTTDV